MVAEDRDGRGKDGFQNPLVHEGAAPDTNVPMRSLPTTKSTSCGLTDTPFRRGEEGEHRATGATATYGVSRRKVLY